MGESGLEIETNDVSREGDEEHYIIGTYQQQYLQRLMDSQDGILSAEQIKKYQQLALELAQEKRADEKKHKYDRLMDRLLTRAALDDELQLINRAHQRHPERKGAVLFLDVNNLKITNDTLGHEVGDEGLKTVNDSVKETIRATDPAGRYGGDEIVIFLDDIDIKDAALIANRLKENQAANSKPLRDRTEGKANMSLSIGITPFRQGVSMEQLIKEADQAMYTSKLQLQKDAIVITGMDNPKDIEETHSFLSQKGLNIPIVGTPLAHPASPLSSPSKK